jgi:hypothetical protein
MKKDDQIVGYLANKQALEQMQAKKRLKLR